MRTIERRTPIPLRTRTVPRWDWTVSIPSDKYKPILWMSSILYPLFKCNPIALQWPWSIYWTPSICRLWAQRLTLNYITIPCTVSEHYVWSLWRLDQPHNLNYIGAFRSQGLEYKNDFHHCRSWTIMMMDINPYQCITMVNWCTAQQSTSIFIIICCCERTRAIAIGSLCFVSFANDRDRSNVHEISDLNS